MLNKKGNYYYLLIVIVAIIFLIGIVGRGPLQIEVANKDVNRDIALRNCYSLQTSWLDDSNALFKATVKKESFYLLECRRCPLSDLNICTKYGPVTPGFEPCTSARRGGAPVYINDQNLCCTKEMAYALVGHSNFEQEAGISLENVEAKYNEQCNGIVTTILPPENTEDDVVVILPVPNHGKIEDSEGFFNKFFNAIIGFIKSIFGK